MRRGFPRRPWFLTIGVRHVLALVVALYRKKDTIQVDQINLLKG